MRTDGQNNSAIGGHMHHIQNQAQNLVFGFVMFAGIIVSGAVLALVFLLKIMKPFTRIRLIRKGRRNLFPYSYR
jgi:hypothetical protein